MLKLLVAGTTLALAATFAVPVLGAPSAQTIRVVETEYRISLSTRPKPGAATFVIRNAGDDTHNFWLRGGGRTWKSRVMIEGGTARLSATLKRGVRYTYWCTIGSHARKGMTGSFVAG